MFPIPCLLAAIYSLLFAYAIEVSQYFHLIRFLNLQDSLIAKLILGTTFSFTDLLSYTFGILLVIAIEKYRNKTIINGKILCR